MEETELEWLNRNRQRLNMSELARVLGVQKASLTKIYTNEVELRREFPKKFRIKLALYIKDFEIKNDKKMNKPMRTFENEEKLPGYYNKENIYAINSYSSSPMPVATFDSLNIFYYLKVIIKPFIERWKMGPQNVKINLKQDIPYLYFEIMGYKYDVPIIFQDFFYFTQIDTWTQFVSSQFIDFYLIDEKTKEVKAISSWEMPEREFEKLKKDLLFMYLKYETSDKLKQVVLENYLKSKSNSLN